VKADSYCSLVQTVVLSEQLHAEGVGLSSRGDVMAVAAAGADAILLFKRQESGPFEPKPYCTLSGISYPHDVSFAPSPEGELLAVAQRRGSITVYRKDVATDTFGQAPVFELSGPKTRLKFSDGVAFVPPFNDYVAACNLEPGTISFYRARSECTSGFEECPAFELRHASMVQPDGLAFSNDGKWLAVANHGNHTVSIFRRRKRILSLGQLRYSAVQIISDAGLRYPHSAAFSSKNHLVVTNAGANEFSVFIPGSEDTKWSRLPKSRHSIGSEVKFREINDSNKMEGGPKGIAIAASTMAICCPQYGVLVYVLH
jgi:DNA-binding beta-propeller fold protein YncE